MALSCFSRRAWQSRSCALQSSSSASRRSSSVISSRLFAGTSFPAAGDPAASAFAAASSASSAAWRWRSSSRISAMMSPMSASAPASSSMAATLAAPRSVVSQSTDASRAGSAGIPSATATVDALPATTAETKRDMPSTVKVPMRRAKRPLDGETTTMVGRSASLTSHAARTWSWHVASSQLRRTAGSPRRRRARPFIVRRCPSRACVAASERSPSRRAMAHRPTAEPQSSSALSAVSSRTVVSSPPFRRVPACE
mmetsp:Transcript_9520/g.27827  ORF Transcript_9520/g.27827 Transcript_9520/m.27827 type:complete len:255 (+) Transcript_9520:467-1231(+)